MPGIYIHIPFCISKCRYCDFTSYPGKIGFAEAYMACVYKEMKLRAKDLSDRVFDTVYFGGGTPSVIDAKLIVGCMNRLRECYRLADGAEITIELNPGTVDAEKIAAYRRAGINRFSIGLQTAVDSQLEELGRIHTAADFLQACELIGDANKSADIMIGLKEQTAEQVRASIDLAVRGGVSHISMYALTPEDGTPIYTDYLNGELPDSDEVAALYDGARSYLAGCGFERYEVSNFAKKGFESATISIIGRGGSISASVWMPVPLWAGGVSPIRAISTNISSVSSATIIRSLRRKDRRRGRPVRNGHAFPPHGKGVGPCRIPCPFRQ